MNLTKEREAEIRVCPPDVETATGIFDPAGYDPKDCAGCGVPYDEHWVAVPQDLLAALDAERERCKALEERIETFRADLYCENQGWADRNGKTCIEVGATGAYQCDHCETLEYDDALLARAAKEQA